jgi:hypothetical protein
MAPKTNGKMNATAEEFVTAWQKATSLREAAEAMGASEQSVSARACHMRARGVPLKKMSGGPAPLDISALAALAKKLAPKE